MNWTGFFALTNKQKCDIIIDVVIVMLEAYFLFVL